MALDNQKRIMRIARYKNVLCRLKDMGFVKVFSDNLADSTGVSSAQVRKDFSLFGITGNRKGGYEVNDLIEKLNIILGKDKVKKVVVVGTGNIGVALMNYEGFEKESIKIAAGFDKDYSKINSNNSVPILPLSEFSDFVRKHNIDTGIIAVPASAAGDVYEMMRSCGIRGVLNFAPVILKPSGNSVVHNVNLRAELETVIYFVNQLK